MKQFQQMQQLLKDENVQALVAHPKVRALFGDPEFQAAIKSQDSAKIMSHPKLLELMRDAEVAPLLAKINPQKLFRA